MLFRLLTSIFTTITFNKDTFSLYGKKPKEVNYKVFMGLRNVKIDICKVFGGKIQSSFVEMAFGDAKKYSNIIHPCPYSVHKFIKSIHCLYQV